MSLKSAREFFGDNWQPLTLYGIVFAMLGILLFVMLGSLPGGYSAHEVQSYQASTSLQHIVHNPLNAPYTLLTRGLLQLHDGLITTRLAATLIGLGTLVVFCALLRHWHDIYTALFGTLLFGTSAWFLHMARGGTPDVLLFGLFLLVAAGVWLRETANPIALLIALLLSASLVYVPGMIWLIGLGIVWEWKALDRVFKKRLWYVTLGGFGVVALLAPLAWNLYRTPQLVKPWLGLPASWPTPLHFLHNVIDVPLAVFVRGQTNPETWLGQLPLLDVFGIAMFAIGAYVYYRHFGLQRVKLFNAILLAGTVLIALGGSLTLTLIVPFIYLVAAAGISYMTGQWFKVFPRNPIAQTIGIGLLVLVIAGSVTYNMRQYFIAWPQASATGTVYVERR
ncbi:MAG TPA: hypothetical protein VMY99_04505 [Nevskiaceae bacterium]|nr:hypothetical protein [Nevskiaceae bacterium]